MQIKQAELQQKEGAGQRDAAMQKYLADLDAQTKLILGSAEAAHQKALEQMKGEHAAGLHAIQAAFDPNLHQAKTEGDQTSQHGKLIEHVMKAHADHAKQMQDVLGHVLEAVKGVSAPREIIRDKAGKAIGVKPINGKAHE
jgi:hypothetical protein